MFDLSLDGGGTKLNALLFDERFQVVARGRGRGVNTTQNSPEQAEEHVRECLEQALPEGLNTPAGLLGGRLSMGERQRIGLARAFLSGCPLILLDEPTSNVDSIIENVSTFVPF